MCSTTVPFTRACIMYEATIDADYNSALNVLQHSWGQNINMSPLSINYATKFTSNSTRWKIISPRLEVFFIHFSKQKKSQLSIKWFIMYLCHMKFMHNKLSYSSHSCTMIIHYYKYLGLKNPMEKLLHVSVNSQEPIKLAFSITEAFLSVSK